MPRIGFLNSGGDCPGLNTVMDAVVKSLYPDYEIYGFYRGWEGLLDKDYKILTPDFTTQFKFMGGTILKSVNKGNFAVKVGLGGEINLASEIIQKTVNNYKELGLEGIIALGGDGSLTVAKQLQEHGIKIIAVPKSIDNDLMETDFTFGFQTAVSIATEALDRLETTGYSHDRIMILEVMGRNAGWVALYSGIAGGANVILIPEIPFRTDDVYKFLNNRGKKNALIVVAEGAKTKNGKIYTKDASGNNCEVRLGGVGESLSEYFNQFEDVEARSTALGHVQRGGSPVAIDRILSRLYGAYAAELMKQRKFGQMVAYAEGKIKDVSIESAVAKLKTVSPICHEVRLARTQGIYFGD